MRKTKIICTIGPASANEETLTQMCLAGMNVARMNFSHGTHAEQKEKMDLVKKVREKLNLPIAIMLDTKGPEYRIRTFRGGKAEVVEGQTFTFTTEEIQGDSTKVSVNYAGLIRDLSVGDRILVNNGLVVFEVEKLEGSEAICRTVVGGTLSDRKSMSFPNKVMSGPFLSEQDKADLLFGIENDVDFVAASFVSTKDDAVALREFLNAHGGENIDIIAKIENRSGVDNIEQICEACEGIMIARGDLGVEIPFVEVPAIQKLLINKCRMLGKRVITATEMLESMIYNPRPTRAEISDVANAVYDGSSAVMLSGESAAGKYPVEAAATMAKIEEGPYYAIPQFPSVHHTMGGLVIDDHTRVYDIYGEVIPGLYAAGEITGGVHGTNRLGSNADADACTFGFISGHYVASGEYPDFVFAEPLE